MSDAPFIISPAGFIADVNFDPAGPQNGFANISPGKNPNGTNTGRGPFDVTQVLPGASVSIRGTGETDVRAGQLSTNRGSMQVDYVTGTAASAQVIATIVGNVGPTTLFLGVCIDSSNRAFFRITDSSGTLVAFSTPSGSAIPAGVPTTVRFAWDATGTVLAGYAFFKVGSVVTPATAFTLPSGGWIPFAPIAVLSGVGGYNSLNDYGGQIVKVQVSSVPISS